MPIPHQHGTASRPVLCSTPPAQNPPKLGPAPAAAGWWPPPGGEFGPKCALWHPGRDQPRVAEATGAHVSWLRAPPARRLPWACKPPARPAGVQAACSPPPSTPAGPRKPLAAPGRAAAGQGELPATPPDYLFPPRSESLSFGERRGSGRERLPATKEAGDRDLTPTEVYLVSARPTTISSLIPSELGSHYSPRDSVNNQYHHNEPGN